MSKMSSFIYLKIIPIVAIFGVMAACNDNSLSTSTLEDPDVVDVSLDATLTVSDENPGGPFANEGSSKLIDGDRNTKFLIFGFHENFWAQQEFESPVAVNAYTMASGNDAPERDPLHWTLSGSNDGTSWEEVHSVNDAVFEARNRVEIYELDSDQTYSYYRLSITSLAGETSLLQLSEWRLLYYNEPLLEI